MRARFLILRVFLDFSTDISADFLVKLSAYFSVDFSADLKSRLVISATKKMQ